MKILYLGREEQAAEPIREVLSRHGIDAEVVPAKELGDRGPALARGFFDLVLVEHLEVARTRTALAEIQSISPHICVIARAPKSELPGAAALLREDAEWVDRDNPEQLLAALLRANRALERSKKLAELERSNQRMVRLVAAVHELSLAKNLASIQQIVARTARALAGADGATFVLREGELCYYAEEDAISPLWKGQRFSMSACVSGWAMLNRQVAVIEDIYVDSRIPADAYRPTFVKSLLMMPIRAEDPIGAIGVYWADSYRADAAEIDSLQALANTTAVALENVRIYAELEQRVRDRTLQLEAANRELEAFSYSVSHDLRGPLGRIGAYSALAAAELGGKAEPSVQDRLERIGREAAEMTRLVEKLLALSTASQKDLRWEPVDLSSLAQGIASRHGAADFQIAGGICAHGDPDLLKLLLENLLSNAWKFTRQIAVPHIEFGALPAADLRLVTCYVRDNGVGFDMAYVEKLFEPFQRLHRQEDFPGTGLGLATARRIAQRHGGELWGEGKPNGGATFYLRLPQEQAAPV